MQNPVDREDFPNCATCPYVSAVQWRICFSCAGEQLAAISNPCPKCAQEIKGDHCRNKLCTGRVGPLYIDSIRAITLHQPPLKEALRRYKYKGKTGWATIFGRLLVGHLWRSWSVHDVDLIIANPPNPNRDHTTPVIEMAAEVDFFGLWPFDLPPDTAIIKRTNTTQSAGKKFPGKQKAAHEHGQALELRHPWRIHGKRVIVYDDICTTGLQLNAVAKRLREWGATSVHGVVLARQPWGDKG